MAIQARETKAGKSISAWVILKRGKHVATVNAHYADAGRVSVDVWNIGDAAVTRCLEAALNSGAVSETTFNKAVQASKNKRSYGDDAAHESYAAYDLFGMQQGSAGGGGYDKFAAAISGMWIDGVRLGDHSEGNEESKKLLAAYNRDCERYKKAVTEGGESHTTYEYPEGFKKRWDDKAKRIGGYFQNYRDGKFTSLYIKAGLDRLDDMGYDVIGAI